MGRNYSKSEETIDNMKQTPHEMVRLFHEAFNHPAPTDVFEYMPDDVVRLRMKLILEETEEVMAAILNTSNSKLGEMLKTHLFMARTLVDMLPDDDLRNIDIQNLAKELADLEVVTVGTGVVFGMDMDKVFAEVHRANMSKLDEDGNPIYREDGKIMKSDQYQPADMDAVLYYAAVEE